MRYALREGLSFCRVEDRLLFLDLPADRYFCLSREAERAVARLCDEPAGDAPDRACLARLASTGLLVERDAPESPAPCPARPAATHSLVGMGPAPRPGDIAAALLHLALARIELRVAGLARTLARAERRKRRVISSASAGHIARTAAAFEACDALVSPHDRCLPRSLAIAHRLISIGARPELVLAVKLGPFKAHAWVRCGDALVNERVEVARRFTPILVL
jgi:hypothetical protein